MGITSRSTFAGRAAALVALMSASATVAFDTPYCSNQNTGSGDAMNSPYQSNGLCTDHCNSRGTPYAFAVVQYNDCWCSNYIPADQEDTSQCRVACPGYPSENCGDQDKGLYIYVQLGNSPSGTQGGSQPSSTADQAPASPTVVTRVVTAIPDTVIKTVTGTPQATTVFSSITSVFTVSTTESTTQQQQQQQQPSSTRRATSSADQPTTTEEPRTSATVVTESGVIITRTVVFTPTSNPASSQTSDSDDGSSNTGAIVGGAVGGIAGLLAIVGGILFLLWRRRKQQRDQLDGEGGQSSLNRNTSTMSKAGLLGGYGAEKHMQYPAAVATSGSQRSRHDDDSIGPLSTSDRRYSQPVLVDSRLNPRAVLTFHGSNESRESLASIDDSRDYGRQLNVVNPDPSRD